jgi:hypothetical protein
VQPAGGKPRLRPAGLMNQDYIRCSDPELPLTQVQGNPPVGEIADRTSIKNQFSPRTSLREQSR